MYIQQLYTKCLAEAAYYIESNGEAAIIDPLREVAPYLELAKSRGTKIKYVFETHFHADFVSGHIDLAAKTGASIVFGPTTMKTGFEMIVGKDGEVFKIGDLKILLLHTPGHTMESSCFLLSDEQDRQRAIFTGDTLFIGDVGRPDLAQRVIAELTQEKLAAHLFDSLRNKIMPLADDLIVYPGHGAGSACGKKMSNETTDTLGHQKKFNYALDPKLSKEEFIEKVLDGLTPPPAYFPQDVLLNIGGYESIDKVLSRAKSLDAAQFKHTLENGDYMIIDTREAQTFAAAFIPQSINIGIDGSFAVWAGTIIAQVEQPILLVCDKGREQEVITRLARVGFDQVMGFLAGGFESWQLAGYPVLHITSIDVEQLYNLSLKEKIEIIDVRKKSEYETQHITGAHNVPLDYIRDSMFKMDSKTKYYVHCAAGYRSMIFCSIMKAQGVENLVDVRGGFSEIQKQNKFPLTEFAQQMTML